jgi:hypothetical protein
LPEDARDDVVAAAGREADDDTNWPRRIFDLGGKNGNVSEETQAEGSECRASKRLHFISSSAIISLVLLAAREKNLGR